MFMRLRSISFFAISTILFTQLVQINSATASAPDFNWTAKPISITSNLSTTGIAISGDGTTKYQYVTGLTTASIYSNHSGSYVEAVLPGSTSSNYLTGLVTDYSGQHVMVALSPFGSSTNETIYYSSNYGSSFSALTVFSGSNIRNYGNIAISSDGSLLGIATSSTDNTSHSQTAEYLLSSDAGSTWATFTDSTYTTNGNFGIAITKADYSATGSNAVYLSIITTSGFTLKRHIYASGTSVSNSDSFTTLTLNHGVGNPSNKYAFSADGVRVLGSNASGNVNTEYATITSTSSTLSFATSPSTFDGSTLSGMTNYNGNAYLPNSPSNKVFFITSTNSAPYISTLWISSDDGSTFAHATGSVANTNYLAENNEGSKLFALKTTSTPSTLFYSADSGSTWNSDIISVTNAATSSTPSITTDGTKMILGYRVGMTSNTYSTSTNLGTTLSSKVWTSSAPGYMVTRPPVISADGSKFGTLLGYGACVPTCSPMTWTYKLRIFSGSDQSTINDFSLPVGLGYAYGYAINKDLSAVAIFDGGAAASSGGTPSGKIYVGTISGGTITWSSALGSTGNYTGLSISNNTVTAIDKATGTLYSGNFSGGVSGMSFGTGPVIDSGLSAANGVWTGISYSADYSKAVISYLGVYSAGSYGGGFVYKSADSGATWTKISGGSSTGVGVATISDNGNLIAYGVTGSYLKLSTDGGANFNNLTSLGTSSTLWPGATFFAPNNYSYAIAAINGAGTLNIGFPGPTLSSISPTSGTTAGGTSVTISGDNIGAATAVTIGGTAATITANSATTLTVTTPTGTAGTADIVVNTPEGISTLTGAFTFTSPGSPSPSLTAQTISFSSLSAMTVGDSDQTITATSDSGLTVSLTSSNTGICTVVSRKVHAVAAGTCTITASQSGDSTYSAATNVVRSLTISSSGSPTAEEIAAAARAAAALAAAERRAEQAAQIAQAKASAEKSISSLSQPGSSEKPSLSTFSSLGLTGVEFSNLDQVNSALSKLTPDQLKDTNSVQAAINKVVNEIAAITVISGADTKKVTVDDFSKLAVNGVTANNLSAVQDALAKVPAGSKADAASIAKIVTQVITEQVNSVSVQPAEISPAQGVRSFALTSVPKDATVTLSKPSVDISAQLVDGVLKVSPSETYSGKTVVPVVVSQAGISKTINVEIVVAPKPIEVAAAVIIPSIVKKSSTVADIYLKPTVNIKLPSNAIGYQLLVNSVPVAAGTGNVISVATEIKPTDKVEVIATGNDGTVSSPTVVNVETKQTNVGVIKFSGTSTILASATKKYLASLVSEVKASGLQTITLAKTIKASGSTATADKQAAAVFTYLKKLAGNSVNIKTVTTGKAATTKVDIIVG